MLLSDGGLSNESPLGIDERSAERLVWDMSMIAAPHEKWFARFESEDGDGEVAYLPVVAWRGDEGQAMCVDGVGGKLFAAAEGAGFSGLTDAAEVELASMSPAEIRDRNRRERERLERLG
ncbi:hypothetical protein [Streptomyces termitum]|uniref:hypothetical protein n=1 Tax=Streptomyces termitum TaxID=67368 RepID=UPI0033BF5BEF